MKQRMINTRFWSDGFIVELNPLDRYLFLYLLTNEHTNICGIYELPWCVMARETGLDNEMLQKMFKRFKNKIYYVDSWIYVKNFAKHQKYNDSVKIGIEKAKKLIPNDILAKISEIDQSGTSRVPVGGVLELESKSELELKPKLEIQSIYKKYQEKINQKSKLTEQAKIKIKTRLKVYSIEELKKAMVKFSQEDWWMKNNSHRGVAWFFHSDDRIDQFLNFKEITLEQIAVKMVKECEDKFGFDKGANIASFRFQRKYGDEELLKYQKIFKGEV